MIHVLSEIRLAPGARERFLAEFRILEPIVRAEDGCIEYVGAFDTQTAIAAQAPVRDDVVMVIEKWESEAALARHLELPHVIQYRKRVKVLVASTVIHVLSSA
ncbi:MAG: putative quinol monooxygenase [bacterium]